MSRNQFTVAFPEARTGDEVVWSSTVLVFAAEHGGPQVRAAYLDDSSPPQAVVWTEAGSLAMTCLTIGETLTPTVATPALFVGSGSVPTPMAGDAAKVVTVNQAETGYELDVPGGGSVPSTVVHSFDVSADPSGINTALVAGVNTGIVIPAGSVVLPLLSLNLSIPVDWDGTSPGLSIGASQAEAVVNITTEPNNTIFNLNTFVNGPVGIGTGAHLQNTINQAITWYFPDDTTLWIALGVVGSGGDPGSTTGTAKLLVAYTPPAA